MEQGTGNKKIGTRFRELRTGNTFVLWFGEYTNTCRGFTCWLFQLYQVIVLQSWLEWIKGIEGYVGKLNKQMHQVIFVIIVPMSQLTS